MLSAKAVLLLVMGVVGVHGHGAMINPAPRSSHNQVLDEHNRCGSSDPYSKAGLQPGEYCGAGCIGEACLYYQIGCFQGCGTCSYEGKTLYPVPADLALAGCPAPAQMPEPTLGGGDPNLEHQLRTYNIDNASFFGDWTKWMPWRSPGSAGRGNPAFQPCGVNSGANKNFPLPPAAGQDRFANGTDLPPLDGGSQATWKVGDTVDAEWAIYANHGGGYSYRICKKVAGQALTEECYQRTPVQFADDKTTITYKDGSGRRFNIAAVTTDKGTFPAGSQWRKNPIPMCNCDIGAGCDSPKLFASNPRQAVAAGKAPSPEMRHRQDTQDSLDLINGHVEGKQCKAVILDQCGVKTGYNTCMKCGTKSSYDCETCCPGLKKKSYAGYTYCVSGDKPGPSKGCSKENPHACFGKPYPKSYLKPGQSAVNCPTGVQYPSSFDDGMGAGIASFQFTMTDSLKVPEVEAGEYSLSWRWDCEETPQVWNSCADITIVA